MFNRALLTVSGQLWKVWLFVALEVLSGFWLLRSVTADEIDHPQILIATAFVLGSFAWFTWSVKCPNCRLKIIWSGVRRNNVSNWLSDIIEMERCPRCGWNGSPVQKARTEAQ